MEAVIQKWGNSNGIRLPKALLNTSGIKEKDRVEIIATENEIIIKKSGFAHKPLKERLAGYDSAYAAAEYDASAIGEERFWENE